MSAPFADRLLDWFDRFGRHDLPWQHPRTPYRVWVSEIMLQQTQVATVIDYFDRFMAAFPTVSALAAASTDEVLALWSGLGYYARGRNLHRAAQVIAANGMPTDLAGWQALPGVGPSTAAAIMAQAYDQPATILDGNVKRVMARHAGIDAPIDQTATQQQLYAAAVNRTPDRRAADYTQAIMDLGATVCRRGTPACDQCPVRDDCVAYASGRTTDLPRRRQRKPLPIRQRLYLSIQDAAGRLLLVRRPPAGIWGGLWCLPEIALDDREVPIGLPLSLNMGLAEVEQREVHRFSHRFTHFQLEAKVCRLEMAEFGAAIEDAPHRWVESEDRAATLDKLGLPGPIATLLREDRI